MTDFASKTRDQILTLDKVIDELEGPPLQLPIRANNIGVSYSPDLRDLSKVFTLQIDQVLTNVQINQVIATFPELEEVP